MNPKQSSIPCPCGNQAERVTGARLYPHRWDLHEKAYYLCSCGRYVGTHRVTDEPLGVPADKPTRKARHAAHESFDVLWEANGNAGNPFFKSRGAAYKWLSREMGVEGTFHIGGSTKEEAEKVVQLCTAFTKAMTLHPLTQSKS